MHKKTLWVMAALPAAVFLASCGGGDGDRLIVDSDPNSCTVRSSGAPRWS